MGRFRPDILGLGVQKGGTTTLHALLQQHPQLYLPRCKEVHYFSLHHSLGDAWYADQFAQATPDQRLVDITPYYLFHPLAPERIRALAPAVKMVVLLRDPVERTLSQLFHSQRLGMEPLSLEQALAAEPERLRGAEAELAAGGRHRSHQEHSYLARSRYELQLARYEALFPAEQLLLLRSEDLFNASSHSAEVWLRLLAFLELEPIPMPPIPRANAGRGEAASVPPQLRQQIRSLLRPTYAVMDQRYGLRWDQ
jgi:hypothetical protein